MISKISYGIHSSANGNEPRGSFSFIYTTITSNPGYNSDWSYPGISKTPYLTSLVENSFDANHHKTHYFTYDHPEDRPSRLSYSQDHWGYFNGKVNAGLIPNPGVTQPTLQHYFPAATADREPDFAYSRKGLLQKIVYPAGGTTQLFYEPNTYHELNESSFSNKHTLSCSVTGTGTSAPWIANTKTINFHIGFTQEITLQTNCTANGSYEIVHNTGKASIRVAGQSSGGYELVCGPADPQPSLHPILLYPGDYTLELKAVGEVITMGANIIFRPDRHITTHSEVEVGGARVCKIINETLGEKTQVRKFFYGSYDDMNTSSLSFLCGKPMYQSWQLCHSGGSHYRVETLYATSLLNLGFFNNGYVSYNAITESIGENFEGGGIESKFYTGSDNLGTVVWAGDKGDILNSPFSNSSSFYNARPRSETMLKKMPDNSLRPVKITEYNYTQNLDQENTIYGYAVDGGHFDALPDTLNPPPTQQTTSGSFNWLTETINLFTMVRYSIYSSWVVPEYSTETVFDESGENPVITTKNYFYENPDNYQLTRTSTTNSENKEIITEFKYPHDFPAGSVYGAMLAKNYISVPVNVKTRAVSRSPNLDITLTEQQTDYIEKSSTLAPNSVDFLPSQMKKSYKGNPLELEGKIDQYDAHSNITQFTSRSGIVTTVLWGYDYRYPVARITGADFETSISALTVTYNALQALDGQALRNAIDAIRNGLPGTQVTSYTYQVGVGILSVTDINNKTSSYEYDSFGRLLLVRDQDNNIINKYDYQYTTPDPNAGLPFYYNQAVSSNPLSCQVCAPGYTPENGPFVYTVPAGRYYSLVSQQDANAQAAADVLENAEEYANRQGNCSNTTACTGEGVAFIGCGCETGLLSATTCSGLNADGTWTLYRKYDFSDGTSQSFSIPMAACPGPATRKVGCNCELGQKECDEPPVLNSNGTYSVKYHYRWSDGSVSPSSYTETISCQGVDKKMINCNCEQGWKQYLSATQCNQPGGPQCCHIGQQWKCVYEYRWSDGSHSIDTYEECNTANCMQGAQ